MSSRNKRVSSDSTYYARVYPTPEEGIFKPFGLGRFEEVEVERLEKKVIAQREFKPEFEGRKEKEFILGGFEFEYHGGYQIDQLLKKVEDEAEAMMNEAKARVESIESEARERGYNEGFEKGRADGYKEVESLMESISNSIKLLEGEREAFFNKSEKEMVDLVALTASEVIAGEIKTGPEVIKNIIRDTVKDVHSRQQITIKMNPADLGLAKDLSGELIQSFEAIEGVSLVGDPSITAGGCVVETNIGVLDSTLENRLMSIYKDLRQKVYL
ncbi:MAG: FliH/SctL family protein [Nitrospinota bacterium]|nr:FliH/SctL family protein [Nitrospinota bacterium]